MDDLIVFLNARLDELEVETLPPGETVQSSGQQYILADIAAKRRILAEHGPETNDVGWDGTETICRRCRYDSGLDSFSYGYCPTIKLLALPFDWHPDYRSEWSTSG